MDLIAYLDPGTGSLIMQAVLGGAAGVAVFVKARGRRMLRKQEKDTASDIAQPPAVDASAPAAPPD